MTTTEQTWLNIHCRAILMYLSCGLSHRVEALSELIFD